MATRNLGNDILVKQTTFHLEDVDAKAIADDCVNNPTRIYNPFLTHMITHQRHQIPTCPPTLHRHTGNNLEPKSAYDARNMLGIHVPFSTPVWCFQRFGQTKTRVPRLNSNTVPNDGTKHPDNTSYRTIYIGGEHEDWYDPDFVIYNDVVVVHGHKTVARARKRPDDITIYGYPDGDFMPTDFHTATYYREASQLGDDGAVVTPARDYIYIIGGLGYPGSEHCWETVTQRLDLQDYSFQRVHTTGHTPPSHCKGKAVLKKNNIIVVTWGKPKEEFRYGLYIPEMRWEKLPKVWPC